MTTKLLTLHEMYEVYRYLEPSLEITQATMSLEDFELALLENLKATPELYLRILELLTGNEENDIIKMTAQEALMVFMEGLEKNRILTFYSFIKELSKDYGPF